MPHEEFRPRPLALDMAEEGIEELRSAQEGVNTSRANVASNVSTPDEELRRRFKNEIGSIRKKAEQALVEALVKYHRRRAERLKNKYKSRRNTVRNNMGILSRRLTRKRNHRLERKLSTKMTMYTN